jgi:hypothetical protein
MTRNLTIGCAVALLIMVSAGQSDAQTSRRKFMDDAGPSYICTPSGFGRTATCTIRTNNKYTGNNIIFDRAG